VLIRNLTGYVEGVMFAILLGNVFAPVLDELFIAAEVRKLRGYKA
jgi:Na+-translocating ferredoxin:NAD+ oxidoreductase RnfD subunit